ncbi:acyl carrier protein [Carboxylicivirga sediminis]|uniref:Acyl carrier protein n=1 Tax=Carboxylicivirga sediminis TaxID=2006564 RepID=A0A941F982_9BACT|nr:acyl carrier protein [Carboxylicivirga sediminis]MBR8537395.1 acyl carrier protein [Carboxylicivirga sediminis]
MNVSEKVISIIAERLSVEKSEITEETAIGDFPKWDSLGHLTIIAGIEDEFGFKFDPEVLMDLEDVGDILEAVEERIK